MITTNRGAGLKQCPKCEIPCQSQNCPHYEGSFNDVELTDKGKEVIQ
jgi:predicted RNA-binding protein with PUA domain